MAILPGINKVDDLYKEVDTDITNMKAKILHKKITSFPDISTPKKSTYLPFFTDSRLTVIPFSKSLDTHIRTIERYISSILTEDPSFKNQSSQTTCKSLQDIKSKILGFQPAMEHVLNMKYMDFLFEKKDHLSVAFFREKLKFYKFTAFM
jgi:hypothetical protein